MVKVRMLSKALQVFSWWAGFPDQMDFIVITHRMSKIISPMLIINSYNHHFNNFTGVAVRTMSWLDLIM